MPKKKKKPAEFRFYEIPQDESVLALMGSKWIQVYGENIDNMHFHNLLEIGYCHYGDGDLVIEDDMYRFDAGMISCIPATAASRTSLLPSAALTTVLAVPFWTVVFVGMLLVAVPPELEPPPLGVELVTVTWTWIVAVL